LPFVVITANISKTLSELECDRDVGRHINRLAVASGGAEANLRCDAASLFIQSVSKSAHHAVNNHFACRCKRDPQNHVSLHLELASFCRVLNGRLRQDLETRRSYLFSLLSGWCSCHLILYARGPNSASSRITR